MRAAVHHLEIWVPDLAASRPRWAWLLNSLGWRDFQDWPVGHSWRAEDGSYLVIEESPDMTAPAHERNRPGLNHLALNADSRQQVDEITVAAPHYGWSILFEDRHPHAGGPDHYAAFLVDDDGYEVEIVAPPGSTP